MSVFQPAVDGATFPIVVQKRTLAEPSNCFDASLSKNDMVDVAVLTTTSSQCLSRLGRKLAIGHL